MELLSTGDHVEDVELLRLVTLNTFVSCVTPASHTRDTMCTGIVSLVVATLASVQAATHLQVVTLCLTSHSP